MKVRTFFLFKLSLLIGVVSATADSLDRSLRPLERPSNAAPVNPAAMPEAAALVAVARVRPATRPVSEQLLSSFSRASGLPFFGPDTSPRPWLRPDAIVQQAMAKRRLRRQGGVCGTVELQGETVGAVPGKLKGCGIKDAVRIRSVAGVRLSQESLLNCDTALALKTWVEKGVKPAFRKRGPVVEMKVAAHYACRTRNNQRGARISEHGRGNAIDISAFVMMDGEVITVLKGWGQGTTFRPLRKVYKSACGPFGTVLGPESDRYHRDHFHVDTARHRGGPYCR